MTANDCLSVDLGMYRIRAAYWETGPEGRTKHRLVCFDRRELFMPSVLCVDKGGKLHFGRRAVALSVSPVAKCTMTRVLENISLSSPVLMRSFSGSSCAGFTARELLVGFLKHIKKKSEDEAGRKFRIAALALPPRLFQSASRINGLKEALKQAGFKASEVCDDCTAVLTACGRRMSSSVGTSLVVDWGYSALRLYFARPCENVLAGGEDTHALEMMEDGRYADPSMGGERAIFLVGKYLLARKSKAADDKGGFTPANRVLAEKLMAHLQKDARLRVPSRKDGEFELTREQLRNDALATYLDDAVEAVVKAVRVKLGDGKAENAYLSGPLCELLAIGDKLKDRGVCSSVICSGANDDMVLGALLHATGKLELFSAAEKERVRLDNFSIEAQRTDLILGVCEKNLVNGQNWVWYGKSIPEDIRTGAVSAISLDRQSVLLVCDGTAVCGDGKRGFVLGTKGIAYRCNPTWKHWRSRAGFVPWEAIVPEDIHCILNSDGRMELVVPERDRSSGHRIDVENALGNAPAAAQAMVVVIREVAKAIQSRLLFSGSDC